MIYTVTYMSLTRSSVPMYVDKPEYAVHDDYKYMARLARLKGEVYDPQQLLAEVIHESEEDSFCFILTNSQLGSFAEWMKKWKLEEYEVYRMPQPVTNGNHPYNGRNLTLVILASKKHVWRDMFETEMESV